MEKLYIVCIILLVSCVIYAQDEPEFSNRVDLGLIEHPELVEGSGVVESSQNTHVLWSHNDRNHLNRLFAFNSQGSHLGIYWIDGVENRDWEDIAIGPGPDPDINYIYIGEIGDNDSVHEYKYIYRIQEPVVNYNQSPQEITLYDVETIIYQYPDGNRDSETLMLDPLTKDIYVVSKREFEDIRVYRAPYPQPLDQLIILEHVATLNLYQVVAGDISSSGLEILLKTYQNIYYWDRDPEQNLWDAFNEDPVLLPYIEEVQGEAVCWAADNSGYYTLSEEGLSIPTHLYFYPRLNLSLVVINEIMHNPNSVEDEFGEWFEITNTSSVDVNLYGWYLQDTNTDFHIISHPLTLLPGEYLVLGNNSDYSTNGGVEVDYQYDNFVLDDSEDEIVILSLSGVVVVDSVGYDSGDTFPNSEGISMALLNANMENSFGFSWRSSTQIFGDGDYGTPGFSNSDSVQSLTIYDIQYTSDPTGHSPLINERVTVSGIISVEPFGFSNDSFFIQDSIGMWSGIMVHHSIEAVQNDSVRFYGTVAEAFGDLTILIDVSDFEVLQNGTDGITPIPVSTGEISTEGNNAEAYESALLNVSGICDNDDLGWREWSIDDGSGSTRIYHALIEDFVPVLGGYYDVTGIQYYRHGNFKLLPRFSSDIIGPSGVQEHNNGISKIFTLHQNYPNPFNPFTTIQFTAEDVGLRSTTPGQAEDAETCPPWRIFIYNIKGQKIKTFICHPELVEGCQGTVTWDGTDDNNKPVSSGIYFYKLKTKENSKIRKMLLLR
jgi:hypothetical protein